MVSCARAGAEYGLTLIWALMFGSILAYTLQEGTARLTIVSGNSLGQCLRIKYRHGAKIYGTAVVCWLVAISVFIGNTLYECNNWAGGLFFGSTLKPVFRCYTFVVHPHKSKGPKIKFRFLVFLLAH